MPMIDVFIPEGALAAPAEAQLMQELTDILIRLEGLDPDAPHIRDVTWIFVHRPVSVYRAGAPAPKPIYRVVPTVPEGQYTDAIRAQVVKEVTDAIARAEGASLDQLHGRVWVFPTEVLDGGWGSRGMTLRLPDIMEYFGGPEYRKEGEARLERKRRADAVKLLGAALRAVEH